MLPLNLEANVYLNVQDDASPSTFLSIYGMHARIIILGDVLQ